MKVMLAAVMVVTASPLFAAAPQQGASSAPNQPIVVNGDRPRQICRRVEALTGSHVSRVRICHTAQEWRALSDTSVDDAQATLDTVSQSQGGYANGVTPRGERPR